MPSKAGTIVQRAEPNELSSEFQQRKFQEALSLDVSHTVIYAMQIQKNLDLSSW